MPYFEFQWTQQSIDHIAENGISQDEFEYVVCNPERSDISRSSGRPAVFAHLPDGRYVFAVYEQLDDISVLPITAYEVR